MIIQIDVFTVLFNTIIFSKLISCEEDITCPILLSFRI